MLAHFGWLGDESRESYFLFLAATTAVLVAVVCSAARATYWHLRRDPIERGIVTIAKWVGAAVAGVFVVLSLNDLGWL